MLSRFASVDALGGVPALLRRAEAVVDGLERLRSSLASLATDTGSVEPVDVKLAEHPAANMTDQVARAEAALTDCRELVDRLSSELV
jgi:hypothetical protein